MFFFSLVFFFWEWVSVFLVNGLIDGWMSLESVHLAVSHHIIHSICAQRRYESFMSILARLMQGTFLESL